MRKSSLFFLIILSQIFTTQAQPEILWSNNYGGSEIDFSSAGIRTSDGGYIVGGHSKSSDNNVSLNYGGRDAWLVKISDTGQIEWENNFGGSSYDNVRSIIETPDGGCLFAGIAGTDTTYLVSGSHGAMDGWLVKLDSAGNHEWHKCYGGENNDAFYDFIQLSDGSFVFVGSTWSSTINGVPVNLHGACDLWLVKTDSLGNIIWQHFYGGYHQDDGSSLEQTQDGGFIICGTTLSDDGNVTGFNGSWDRWILKTDSLGTLEWAKCYGGTDKDAGRDIVQCSDGGYIAVGESKSIDGHISSNHGDWDAWVTRIDSVGNLLWERALGGSSMDVTSSIIQTMDNEYLVSASTKSIDGDITFNHGMHDHWLVKMNDSAGINWQKCFGGSDDEMGGYGSAGESIEIAYDEYFIIGASCSSDGDVLSNYGADDYWVFYLDCDTGPLAIEISDTVYGDTTTLTAIGDFIEYLWSTGDTTQSISIDSAGLYHVFAYTIDGCYNYCEISVPGPALPYNDLEICMVTYEDSSGFNVIVYEPVQNVGIDSIQLFIYDTLSSNYEWIGANHIDEEGTYYDEGANPDLLSYKYKLAIQDTFGNISDFSPYHESMYLSAIINPNNEIVLSWNPYVGFEYNVFEVYRSVSGGAYEIIANTEDTSYTDQAATTGQLHYKVKVEKDTTCNPGNNVNYSHSSSNPIIIQYDGITEFPETDIRIFPNPFDEQLIISREDANESLRIEVIDIYGRLQQELNVNAGEHSLRISTNHMPTGLYFIRINNSVVKRIIKH